MNPRNSQPASVATTVTGLLVFVAAAIAVLVSGNDQHSYAPPTHPHDTPQPADTYYQAEPTPLSATPAQPGGQPPPASTTTPPPVVINPENELDPEREDDHHPAPTHEDEPAHEGNRDSDHDDRHDYDIGDGRIHIWRWLT